MRRPPHRPDRLSLNIGLLLGSSVLAMGLFEATLRAVGFSFTLAPERVEFGYPDPVVLEDRFVPDPDLFWVTPMYQRALARITRLKPQIVFLGDSCTRGPYPQMFLRRIRALHPQAGIAGGTLGIGGWSSYQGLQQLRRDVAPLRPRVVTLYYGWNDHWIGFGLEDKEIHELSTSWLARLDSLRLAQLLVKAQLALRTRGQGTRPERVAPEDFRANLIEMCALARKHDIVPVLLTAPTSHEVGREPAYLAVRHLRDLADLVPLHQRYVRIVRDVARSESVPLCDLAARFDALPRPAVRHEYFGGDGIHLTPAGNEKIAEFLSECFEANSTLRGVWSGPVATGAPGPVQDASEPSTASNFAGARLVPNTR
ncbi:MAG: SGNH/GDSL hydrolase family protein [Myxococcota bacterium]